jgi:hypothetical protein
MASTGQFAFGVLPDQLESGSALPLTMTLTSAGNRNTFPQASPAIYSVKGIPIGTESENVRF